MHTCGISAKYAIREQNHQYMDNICDPCAKHAYLLPLLLYQLVQSVKLLLQSSMLLR